DGAAGSGDLVLGAGRERVRADLQLHAGLARAEDLDELTLADGALGHQGLDGDLAAVREQLGQPVQVDHLVLGAERVLEAPQLRQPHVQGHLTALEPGRDLVAGLGALGPATCGLALRALTATDPGPRGLGPGSRPQVVDLEWVVRHQSTSSTVTRCDTVLTMPRISGRSSLTTTSPIRFRPSERRVWRLLSFTPTADRTWVTLRRAIMHPPPAPGAAPPGRPARGRGHDEP